MQRKWIALCRALKEAGKYYEPRLKARLLSGRYHACRPVIRICDHAIQAYAALWRTNHPDWYELGNVWVGKRLRGRGLRDILMMEAMAVAPQGAHLFLITSVGAIKISAERLGFKRVTTQTHPELLQWASEVGVVCRLPSSIHPIGQCEWQPFVEGKRSLFLREAQK